MSDGQTAGSASAARVTKPFFLLGIGLVLLGALSIYAPQQSGTAVGILVGIFLLISGLFRTSLFWIATSWGSALLRLLLGLLAIVAGALMLADPALGLQAITIVAIVYLIIDGITALIFGMSLPPGAGGIWIILSGLASVVLGVLIWRNWPLSGDQAVGILIGIKLILDGAVLIALAAAGRVIGRAVARA